MIVVCGEALIDLISTDGRLTAVPGGGPFNTAVALGRLDVPAGFLAPLSRDRYGELLQQRLVESGVDTRYTLRSDAPTPLAVAHVGPAGEAQYTFYLAGTAYADVPRATLPDLDADVVAIHLGTLALATDPPRETYEALMARESGRLTVMLDPNVRPQFSGDSGVYRRRFEDWLRLVDIVKLSHADSTWLYPELTSSQVCERLLDAGASLVVLTQGAGDVLALSAGGLAAVPPPRVDVVDTVGAGDAFGAGLLRRLWHHGRLGGDALGRLDDAALEDLAAFAAAVGALQCTREGSSPPTLAEVEAFVGSGA